MIKILQILPELHVGGVETGTVDMAKYLMDHGHEAVVVSNGGELVADCEKTGARHYRLPVHKKNLWTMMRCVKKLRQIIIDEKIDIVHARSRVPAWIAFFACRHTEAEFLTTCHGYYSRHVFSRVMGWAKLVIVPSQVIGRRMIEDFGVSTENIRRIPRSVDIAKFKNIVRRQKTRPEAIITIIGRITPLKGHAYFLKAMAKVVRSIPYAKIWIVGDTPHKKESYKEELQVLIRRLGLADYVDFLGNRRDIPRILSNTDVLVLSTVTEEAFGRVILEAQCAKVPVVATRVGGVVEIVEDEKTGLLVTPKDTEAMAKAVMRILKDPALANHLSEEGRKNVENHFTLEHMASRTLEVYQELMKSSNILVVKISSLGDVILVVPSLRAIRKKYPRATIHALVGQPSRSILQRCPYIDGLIVCDLKSQDGTPWGLMRLSKKLRRYKFDKIIDFQNNVKSHLLSFLIFPKESYGFNNGKFGFLLSSRAKYVKNAMAPVRHQFEILKMLDIAYSDKDALLELWPSPQDEAHIQNLLDGEWLGNAKNMVGINIAASERWKSKNWPPEHIAKLCDMLSSKNVRCLMTGTEQDKDLAHEICTMSKSKPANFVGKTDILQLAALIKRCRAFVTPDSAPLHIAAAVKTPIIALFGPTDPARHVPAAGQCRVLRKDLKCIACYSPRCEIIKHDCMRTITPEEVAKEIALFISIS